MKVLFLQRHKASSDTSMHHSWTANKSWPSEMRLISTLYCTGTQYNSLHICCKARFRNNDSSLNIFPPFFDSWEWRDRTYWVKEKVDFLSFIVTIHNQTRDITVLTPRLLRLLPDAGDAQLFRQSCQVTAKAPEETQTSQWSDTQPLFVCLHSNTHTHYTLLSFNWFVQRS